MHLSIYFLVQVLQVNRLYTGIVHKLGFGSCGRLGAGHIVCKTAGFPFCFSSWKIGCFLGFWVIGSYTVLPRKSGFLYANCHKVPSIRYMLAEKTPNPWIFGLFDTPKPNYSNIYKPNPAHSALAYCEFGSVLGLN